MKLIKLKCAFCGKDFLKPLGRVNEAKKFGWKPYCSLRCQYLARNKQKTVKCANPLCGKIFKRQLHEIPSSGICFCSHSCAAVVNNSKKERKKKRESKICPICGKQFFGERKFCSDSCYSKFLRRPKISKNQIIKEIKEFYKREGRIPLKEEYHHYTITQRKFGSWNKAIEAAGFEPNPVMFAKKYIANDGHECDSLAEKIIDDWLYARKIKHKRRIPYPGDKSLTADFVIGNNWIEFLGLNGVISRYDELVKKKRRLSKKYKLPLIEIYPKDLFPINHLSEIIKVKKA